MPASIVQTKINPGDITIVEAIDKLKSKIAELAIDVICD